MPPSAVGSGTGMSSEDKIRNKVDELAGKAKEAAGRATDGIPGSVV